MPERNTFMKFGENQSPSIDFLKAMMEDARVTTLNRVHGISTEELHWQYAEGWNTVGALLSHIWAVETWFAIAFIEKRKPTEEEIQLLDAGMEMGKKRPQLITNEPLEVYVKKLEESRAKMFERIATLTDKDFTEKLEGYNPNTGYNVAWALYHAAEDEIHHRGQISIIRKLYKQSKPV